jgi:hypothetical protein
VLTLPYQAEPLVSFDPSFEGCQHRLCPYSAFGLVTLPQILFRLFIPFGNSRGWFFAFHGLGLSTFLPPFAPPGVSRFRSMVPGLSGVGFPMACLRSYGGSDFCRAPFGILPRQF